jgi:hypothetical protein
MGNNKRVSEESFGVDPATVKVSGGSMPIFGHTVKGGAIPDRGTSVNVKTGYPSKGQGK